MFYGEYLHTLDKKSRLIIPSRFRDVIKEMCIEKFYITRGLDKCLFMLTENEWKQKESKYRSMSVMKSDVRKFERLYFSGAVEAIPDKQWRVLVPNYLKEYANLSKNVIIVGLSNRIEIWDKNEWNDFYKTSKQNYEEIAERLIET